MGDDRVTADLRRPGGGLGRGLAALIPSMSEDDHPREISIDRVRNNPYQPRKVFDEDALASLSASILEHGLLQPILVTPLDGGMYQLVAGERRLRAAERAGLHRVPAIVRSADRQQQLALALVENLQRSDLNAMDEARAFRRLIDEFGLTQEDVAARVGRSRPAITNTLHLLDASAAVQNAVEANRISEGHARALAGVADPAEQERLLALIETRQLSVRDTERLVRELKEAATAPTLADHAPKTTDPDVERIEAVLRNALATKVALQPGPKGGRITITYFDADDLSRIVERLAGPFQ